MRIAIVEDEAMIARRLERMIRSLATSDIESVDVAPTLDGALDLVRTKPIDLLFLDLNLNGRHGFRLLEEVADAPFQTIVVSAHHDQALRAFDYGVTDFVAKPWSEDRLRKALDRALGRSRCLSVRKGRELRRIPIDRVVYIQAADDFSELHLDDGTVHLHQKSLAAIAALLPETFVRVHRSYIANTARVRGVRADAVVFTDGRTVPVGRRYRTGLRG